MNSHNNYKVIGSYIDDSTQIFNNATVTDSKIANNCIIGESSRVKECTLEELVSIDRNNFILGSQIGRYSYTGPFDMIFHTIIGSFCSISYGVTIGPPDHDFKYITTHPFLTLDKYKIFDKQDLLPISKFDKRLTIGHDVWIGCNSTILRGVKIGNGAIIGANALVNKDVPPYAIAVGVPAKIIKYRFSKEIVERLQNIRWWEWDIGKIRNNQQLFNTHLSINQLNQIND